jgi:heterodisulfide reductase subunit C
MNHNFKKEVADRPGGENITLCYSCGTCTAGCPVSEVNKNFNPRVYIRKILLGFKDEVLKDENIWQCIQCHRCVAHCPQNVKFADILRVIREIAVEQGYFEDRVLNDIEELDTKIIQYRARITEKYLKGDKKIDDILQES